MMSVRKRIISIISVITLILAIAVGIALSAAATSNNDYVGERIGISNTDVSIDAKTSTRTDETIPDGVSVVEIATAEQLQDFINLSVEDGIKYYGVLTADIALDWSGVGSQAYLASAKTIDGNGHSITLSDAQATANVDKKTGDGATFSGSEGIVSGVQGGFTDPLDGSTNSASRNYGMFVDFNMGTIKNIKFLYSQTAHSVANSDVLGYNYVGIICGTNSGTISNCDLTVTGSADVRAEFGYFYCRGSVNSTGNTDVFTTIFGGVAGRNGGVISGITATYSNFNLILNTRGQNSGSALRGARADARVSIGGIAGVMYSPSAKCMNIIILSEDNMDVTMTAQRKNATFSEATAYREIAAVVPGNSQYSHGEGGIGDKESTQGEVDNIIVDFNAKVNANVDGKQTMGNTYSRNAVVFCGRSYNVTMLRVTDNYPDGLNQHVDYQTDSCNCISSNTSKQHDMGYGNIVHTGNYSNVTVGFDEDYNQVITVEPKDKEKSMLGEIAFNKYSGRSTTTEASVLEPGIPDNTSYNDPLIPNNSSEYLYNKVDIRQDKYTVKIKPYQEKSDSFWEIGAYSYQIATLANIGAEQHTYTGEDFLPNQFGFTTLSGDKSGTVNPEGLNIRSVEAFRAIKESILPGEYNLTLQEKEAGLCYVDTQNQVVAYLEETPTQYSFAINLAQIVALNENWIGDNWLSSRQDFTFELSGGIEGAADGYVYTVNGSQPTNVSGLVMENDVDTRSEGREYTVTLTKGGVAVTQPYTFRVRVDLTNPTAEIVGYEHPANEYFTHNKITIKATDSASGVASIVINSYGADGSVVMSDNIMEKGTLNSDGTYDWLIEDANRKEIVITDNVGHSTSIEVSVKIDTVQPKITVDAYYFEAITDDEGNTEQIRKDYTSGLEVTSAVYFEASATYGESGGEIRYSLDNGLTWQVYTEKVTVKRPAEVKFIAVSNTYDHDDSDVTPRPLVGEWEDGKVIVVNIQLQQVVITLDDLIIEGATKTFDGSDVFNGTVSVRDDFAAEKSIEGEVKITSVKYASVNAGSDIELIIEISCTDDTKLIDNQIEGAVGVIEKKVVNITIDDKTKIYGVSLPELTYTQEGMVAGFEESVELYVQRPDGYDGAYESLPTTADGEGYTISLVDGIVFDNYVLGSVTQGKLIVTLAPVDRLVYERGQFTGLDLNNIATRNLEIGFIRSDGIYEKLNVTFYALDKDSAENGYTVKVDDITKAGAGFFKVVISLPENDSQGMPLSDKYVMDEKITEFMIKIIDSTIFDKDDEEVEDTEKDTTTSDTENTFEVGKYENGATDTDNTDTAIAVTNSKNNEYVAIIAIFCSVVLAIAFAIGVGRVIIKKVKSK